jgi:hypothetical protein
MPANSITVFKKYVPLLDEAYKLASLTSVLDGPNDMAREGANAGEIVIPDMVLQGLVGYARNTGFTDGTVTLQNTTYACNYERGRMFMVDAMDNAETAGVAFGRLAGEFIRMHVAPEIDAFRIAKYAGYSGVGGTEAALATGADVVAALRAAIAAMDNGEVPLSERYLFITPNLYGMVEDLDTTKSRAVLSRFQKIIQVPQTRMYTAITLSTSGNGGYSKSTSGKALNFLAVHKSAVIQYNKHIAPKVVTPEQNQTADAWKFGYRVNGIAEVFKNKKAGIYAHNAPATT